MRSNSRNPVSHKCTVFMQRRGLVVDILIPQSIGCFELLCDCTQIGALGGKLNNRLTFSIMGFGTRMPKFMLVHLDTIQGATCAN